MKRGEVWWADLPAPAGRRPVLLLSRNKAYEIRSAVTVAEITSIIRQIPVEVQLSKEDGMPKKCVVNLDTMMTIPKNLLTEYLTTLSSEKMITVEEAIRFALNLR
jgi:mRNA interferase MazF